MRVCILITTYKRNLELSKLVSQILYHIKMAHQAVSYRLVITDSDPHNQFGAALSAKLNIDYMINPGLGFDDNLLNAWLRLSNSCDYIFSISDDDLITPYYFSVFDVVSGSLRGNGDAYLFNHCEYRILQTAETAFMPRFYVNSTLSCDKGYLLEHFLECIPRHAGLIYKTSFLDKIYDKLLAFRGSLDLYAVPFILAALEEKASFIDFPLVLFNAPAEQNDGAWENHEKVFLGLVEFLASLKPYLSPAQFRISYEGFRKSYFSPDSFLRSQLSKCPPSALLSEADVEQYLFD